MVLPVCQALLRIMYALTHFVFTITLGSMKRIFIKVLQEVALFLFCFLIKKKNNGLDVPGLSCGMWDLVP